MSRHWGLRSPGGRLQDHGSHVSVVEQPRKPHLLGKERKEQSKIHQGKTFSWLVFTWGNHSAFLSFPLFLALDDGLQASSQKYRMWENLSKRAKPGCFQPFGEKPFVVAIIFHISYISRLVGTPWTDPYIFESYSVLGMGPLMILCHDHDFHFSGIYFFNLNICAFLRG